MFDREATTTDAAVEACREQDWVKLHGEIRSVFTQRTVLKARQLVLLLEADETRHIGDLERRADPDHIKRSHHRGHELNGLTLLCDGHHKQHHDGLLLISGQAPDALVFELTSVPAGTEPDA